jgi:hypothetical protein
MDHFPLGGKGKGVKTITAGRQLRFSEYFFMIKINIIPPSLF